MRRAKTTIERSRTGPTADRHAADVASNLGKSLRDRRQESGPDSKPGVSARWIASGNVESSGGWSGRAFHAGDVGSSGTCGRQLCPRLFEAASAADRPRDAAHLEPRSPAIATAKAGAWHGVAEEPIDAAPGLPRFADVLLSRPRREPAEVALFGVIDWFSDVGAPMRDWPRRLEAVGRRTIARMVGDAAVPRVSGCWVVRGRGAIARLVSDHANLFRSRFPGRGRAWLAALTDSARHMPDEPVLLWVSVDGQRLWPVRAG